VFFIFKTKCRFKKGLHLSAAELLMGPKLH
jgi:hypothetical protein